MKSSKKIKESENVGPKKLKNELGQGGRDFRKGTVNRQIQFRRKTSEVGCGEIIRGEE